MQKRQKTRKPQIEQQDPQQQDPAADYEIPPSLDSFFDSARADDQTVRILLYRRTQPTGGGRPKRYFVEEYADGALPNMHDIGMAHGGGEYEIMAIGEADPERKIPKFCKTVSFNIDPRYDRLKSDRESHTLQLLPAPIPSPADSFEQGLKLVTQLVTAISPLMQQGQSHNNPSEMIATMATLGQTMLQQSFKSQMESQKMLMETMRDNMPDPASIPGEDGEDRTFIRIMQALEMFIPIFLSGPAATQNALVAAAKAQPDLKNVLADKVKKHALRKKLVEKYGEEQATQIYSMFDDSNGKEKPAYTQEELTLET